MKNTDILDIPLRMQHLFLQHDFHTCESATSISTGDEINFRKECICQADSIFCYVTKGEMYILKLALPYANIQKECLFTVIDRFEIRAYNNNESCSDRKTQCGCD